MSEFINVTEVEKLPIDRVDSLIAIDANKGIKRTSITVDQVIDEDSTNPISSKGVWDALEEFREDVAVAVEDINDVIQDLDDDIADIRDEIIVLNEECATKDWVDKEIKEAIDGGVNLSNYYTKSEVDAKISEIPTPDLTGYATESWVDEKGYATESYVTGLVGDINAVLDQINGEVV